MWGERGIDVRGESDVDTIGRSASSGALSREVTLRL